MSISGSSLKGMVLTSILRSFDPFKIGLRRKDILNQVTHGDLIFQIFDMTPKLLHAPLKSDEKNALNMRLQRVLDKLVQEELIKRKTKDNKQTFYLLDKDTFPEVMEYLEEYAGREIFLEMYDIYNAVWDKNFRQKIINRSNYLKLPNYMDIIPLTDWLFIDLTYDEFRSRIMNLVVEVLEPQIKAQYELMIKRPRKL